MRKLSVELGLLFFCLGMLLCMALSYYRADAIKSFMGELGETRADSAAVNAWAKALRDGNQQEALRLAGELVGNGGFRAPPEAYLRAARETGINAEFFNPPFNVLDYLGWREAFHQREIAEAIVNEPVKVAEKVFAALRAKVKLDPQSSAEGAFRMPSEAWDQGHGSVSDLQLLFTGVMTQCDYQTQVVFLFNDTGTAPLHIVCEVRNGQDVAVCDFLSGRFWSGESVSSLAANPAKLKGVWQESWIKALAKRVYTTQALATDYRGVNNTLHARVTQVVGKTLPIFGLPPLERLEAFKKLVGPLPADCEFVLWPVPFLMIQKSPAFNPAWKTPPAKAN